MIRVVYCVDSFEEAGTELNTVRWAERLDRDRFDLRVVCLSTRGALLDRYRELQIPVVPCVLGSFVKPPPIGPARRLRRYLRAERIDVVHTHSVYDNIFGVPVAKWAGTPGVLASRRWWKTPVKRAFGPLNRLSYRLADGVLANSNGVARILRDEDGVPEDRIHVIPNFVEDAAFAPPDPDWRDRQMETLGVPASAKLMGKVARLRPEKDHSTLVRAFSQIAERHPDWHLVFVGDGPEEERLRTQIEALSLSHRIHLAGKQPSRPSFHGLFEISLLSSTSEGFPNSLLEAMAQAKPLVATDVGGVPDAVQEGRNGFLVPPGNTAAFTTRIERLIESTALRAEMGEASRQMAQGFSEARTMSGLQQLYERLAEND